MRCYVIEDFYPEHLQKITAALTEKGFAGSLDGIFYLPLPQELLTETQREHAAECGPHICVLEVIEEGALKLELLVRAQNKLRCECVFYATPAQREHIISSLDDLVRQLDISV
ncbi:hypothetical protein [Humidesulfovibrio sp.]